MLGFELPLDSADQFIPLPLDRMPCGGADQFIVLGRRDRVGLHRDEDFHPLHA